jgi:hypothetical protein
LHLALERFFEKRCLWNYTGYFNTMIGTFHNLKTFNQQKNKKNIGLGPPKVGTWPPSISNSSLHKQSFSSIISNMFLNPHHTRLKCLALCPFHHLWFCMASNIFFLVLHTRLGLPHPTTCVYI